MSLPLQPAPLGQHQTVTYPPRSRLLRLDTVTPTETRSELVIVAADADANGTYVCHADNKAADATANFTVVVNVAGNAPTILQVKGRMQMETLILTRNVSNVSYVFAKAVSTLSV